ncbi:MAG: PEGA domain-containing protein, partial [Proteobacteria bacterium]|nr:PEGA domain-containing protein [Pseudomonadota bacterium]
INGNRLSIYLVTLGIALAVISLIALWWLKTVPDMGKLFVQTNPSGAEVTIDGKRKGFTPLALNLKTGPHYVILTKAGYYPWEAEVKIKETDTLPLKLDLIQKDMP